MSKARDLSKNFIHLRDNASAELIPVTWRLFSGEGARYDRLLGAVDFTSSADLHGSAEEMHPGCDEVLYLVSGALEVVLHREEGEHRIELDSGQAAIIPRGVWHRLSMRRPGRLLFINSRTGMESRPALKEEE